MMKSIVVSARGWWLLLLLALVGCVDIDGVETGQSTEPLVNGAPLIVSTTINAPIVNGRYQLIAGKSYTATVVVDAGTITYLTRVEANGAMTAGMVGNQVRDETVIAYAGRYQYTFPLAAQTTGSYQVAFKVRDRGTWNVYQWHGGVAVTVSSAWTGPRIASTTIAAPILDGRYVLYAGQPYQVRVVVAMSNVTYNARVESNGIPSSMHLSQSASNYVTMPAFGADRVFTFTIVPDPTDSVQIAFRLRDAAPPTGTGNAFAHDGGIAATVRPSNAPRISSTTIAGVTPRAGQYVLTIGQPYDVVVRVVPGSVVYTAAVEPRDPLAIPASANLHNNISAFATIAQPTEFRFTLTPTDVGTYPIAFQMRDAPVALGGTLNAFNPDPGIVVVAAAPDAPRVGDLYGKVTEVGGGSVRDVRDIRVRLDSGTPVELDSTGGYHFSSVPPGTHRVFVESISNAYSPATAVNVTVPAAGIRVDVSLEEPFAALRLAGMPYQRFIDYARGRTLFHVVRVDKARDRVEILPSHSVAYETAPQIASRLASYGDPDPGVAINGGYFDYDPDHRCGTAPGNYLALGYAYYGVYTSICEYSVNPSLPMSGPTLGVTSTSQGQWNRIVDKSFLFDTTDWHRIGTNVAWDDDRNNVSDVDYALQTEAWLVRPLPLDGICPGAMVPDGNSCVVANESRDTQSLTHAYWARTAVAVGTNGDLVLVVADGEGRTARHGANFAQISQLLVHELGGVYSAMTLDGGGSTQMAIYSEQQHGYRLVNTPTGENDSEPGAVLNFVLAWPN